MDREFYIGSWSGTAGFLSEDRPIRTLREILGRLREAYCGHIGWVGLGWAGRCSSCFAQGGAALCSLSHGPTA